eukprot:5470395-Amphidinium_carterae.1
MYGRFACAKSAWNETSQHQIGVLMASCVPLLYNNMLPMACTILTDYWRLHFIATRPVCSLLVVLVHTCILRTAACFYCNHITWGQPAKRSIAGTEPKRWQRLVALRSRRVHRVWFGACVLTAAPGVVYSTVKA